MTGSTSGHDGGSGRWTDAGPGSWPDASGAPRMEADFEPTVKVQRSHGGRVITATVMVGAAFGFAIGATVLIGWPTYLWPVFNWIFGAATITVLGGVVFPGWRSRGWKTMTMPESYGAVATWIAYRIVIEMTRMGLELASIMSIAFALVMLIGAGLVCFVVTMPYHGSFTRGGGR
jgi:hypothetical protein